MSLDSQSSHHLLTSDPTARYLGVSCLDLLLIEIVPMAERMTEELNNTSTTTAAATTTSTTAKETATTISGKLDDEELQETTFYRLESLGYRVGQGLAERFSRDRPRFADNLDVIKFICKDLWTILFKKQIDNLKTNHRGVYVLSDNTFRPLTRMSMTVRSEAVSRAEAFLWFPCGLIRGCLANLGISATVQAETSELPGATFQIKTNQAKT